MAPKRLLLGVLVPSSNTALEPLTQSLITSLNLSNPSHHVTVHFSRFAVTSISLSPDALAQFELEPILAAAELLAHAEVDVIGWSGTSAGWLGIEWDHRLVEEIEKKTGIKATTSVLALNQLLGEWGVKKLGLVTPYADDVQEAIVKNYEKVGIEIVERHLKITKNGDIADVAEKVLDGLVEEVCSEGKVDAVTTFCTNFVAAHRVSYWEEKYDVPVFDTVTTVVWHMLSLLGVDSKKIVDDWGTIFKSGP